MSVLVTSTMNHDTEIRYSIVMTAYNRQQQLERTLESFRFHGYGSDVEVIIVDDGSFEPVEFAELIGYDFVIRLIRIDQANKWYKNPCIPFNIGLRQAKGETVIIQNAECLHRDNIIRFLERATTTVKSNYISFACYSLDKEQSAGVDLHEFNNFVEISAGRDGSSGWYNHSVYRPAGYHFCAAIKRQQLEEIGYFDELYAMGTAFDDDEFLVRIQRCMAVRIIDNCVVLHQWHYSGGSPRSARLFARNRLLLKLYTRWGFPAWLVLRVALPIFLRLSNTLEKKAP